MTIYNNDMALPISHLVNSQQLSFITSFNRKAAELTEKGEDVIKLSGGDPSHYPQKLISIMQELSHTINQTVLSYSPIAGFDRLRELLGSVISIRHRHTLKKENVLVCSGGCSGLFLTFKTLLNPKDRVLIQDPCWEYLPHLIENCGGIPVKLSSSFLPGTTPNWDALLVEITAHLNNGIKAISINSPLNPSGTIMPVEIKNRLIALCEKYKVWFISDDVTIDFNYVEPYPLVINNSEYFISVNSFSKNLGITGLRFGFVAANSQLIEQIKKSQLYTSMYPNSFIQKVIEHYLALGIDHHYDFIDSIVMRYKANAKAYTNILSSINGLEVFQPEGGLFLFPRIKTGYQVDFHSLLEQHHTAVAPGQAFSSECKDYFRLFLGVNTDTMVEGKKRIESALTTLNCPTYQLE